MINLTNHPRILCDGAELDTRIRAAISRLKPLLYEKYGAGYDIGRFYLSSPDKHGRNLAEVFDRLVNEDGAPAQLGADFVYVLMDCVESHAQRDGFEKTFGELANFFPRFGGLNSSLGVRVKGVLKLLLLAMWAEKAILLPYSFTFGGTAILEQAPIIDQLVNDLFRFFRAYKDGGHPRPDGTSPLSKDAPITLYKYAPRVILATSYQQPRDVDITELCEFLVALRKLEVGEHSAKTTIHAPVLLMAKELLVFHPDEVLFSQSDLEACSVWLNSPVFQRTAGLKDFLTNRKKFEDDRLRRRAYKGKTSNHDVPNARTDKLATAVAKDGHAALLDYYQALHGIRRDGIQWLRGNAPYPGREHVELGALSALWFEAFSAYMKYRKVVQNFDATDGMYRAFNYLCDYLFLYLPWWKELNPDTTIDVPLAPNQLKRGVFIQRTILAENGRDIDVDQLPMTFLDLLATRQRSVDARYGTMNNLIQFFEWVEIAFEEDGRIGGKGYRSPFKRIDLPKVKRRTKTNKVPFSKKVYPHLLFYSYALESFGQYLQQVAVESPEWFALRYRKEQKFLPTGPTSDQAERATELRYAAAQPLYPADFGYVPFICYRGKNYPITRVPNVYQWDERTVEGSRFGIRNGPMKCWMPHLGTLRMLIGAIETGLRLQSLQWLDVRTWDSENTKAGVPQSLEYNLTQYGLGGFALPLVVSTDKTKDEAWVTQIVFRLRNCFAREQYFRDSIVEPDMDKAVDYEGIPDSRFGQISPLFRSAHGPTPTNDHTYANYWTALLWGFEEYYNAQVSQDGFTQFVYLRKTDQEMVPDYESVDFFDLLAINTPHACRATYATNRTGSLEASDVAMQLGQSNTVVTAHYTVSTPEVMAEKLAYSDRLMLAEFEGKAIRADKPDSALRRSFLDDREATIKAFMFAPAVALWSMDDLKSAPIGLEALRNSPMSQIIFHETHICPVGDVCPSEVLEKLGATKRCGMCSLSMKCVDHLQAIVAKIHQLKMRVRTDIRRAQELALRGEPEAVVDALYEAAEADANEIVGWQLSHDILYQLRQRNPDVAGTYHVETPEIVQRHLTLVTADRKMSEFLLQRIVEADAFPSLADPEIQRIADRFHRHLMGAPVPNIEADPVAVLAGLIRTQLAPRGIALADLAAHIDDAEKSHTTSLPVLFGAPAHLLGVGESKI